jgi:hypothetical protein
MKIIYNYDKRWIISYLNIEKLELISIMKDSDWDSLKVVDRNFSYFGRGWLQILLKITPFFLRSCVVVICFLFNICIRKCLCPVVMILLY